MGVSNEKGVNSYLCITICITIGLNIVYESIGYSFSKPISMKMENLESTFSKTLKQNSKNILTINSRTCTFF